MPDPRTFDARSPKPARRFCSAEQPARFLQGAEGRGHKPRHKGKKQHCKALNTRPSNEARDFAMEVEYGDITSEEALTFSLPNPAKAREDTLTLLQVCTRYSCRCRYAIRKDGTEYRVVSQIQQQTAPRIPCGGVNRYLTYVTNVKLDVDFSAPGSTRYPG